MHTWETLRELQGPLALLTTVEKHRDSNLHEHSVDVLICYGLSIGGFQPKVVLNGLMVGGQYDITACHTALVGKIRHTDTCTGE